MDIESTLKNALEDLRIFQQHNGVIIKLLEKALHMLQTGTLEKQTALHVYACVCSGGEAIVHEECTVAGITQDLQTLLDMLKKLEDTTTGKPL